MRHFLGCIQINCSFVVMIISSRGSFLVISNGQKIKVPDAFSNRLFKSTKSSMVMQADSILFGTLLQATCSFTGSEEVLCEGEFVRGASFVGKLFGNSKGMHFWPRSTKIPSHRELLSALFPPESMKSLSKIILHEEKWLGYNY